MTGLQRGLLLAAIQVALVGAVAGKLYYDRATLPRVWVESTGVDPNLPIRGRYVALNLLFPAAAESVRMPATDNATPGRLEVREGQAVAVLRPDWSGPKRRDEQLFASRPTPGGLRWMAVQPVALFLPEHAADPTRGNQPDELWVEVTVPPRGAARPIRVESRR
jgi:hypothetical protein